MVYRMALAILLLFTSHLATYAAPLESPDGPETIRAVREHHERWRGVVVALRSHVTSVEYDSKGQPLVHMRISSNDAEESFWLASLTVNRFSIGDETLLLGLVSRLPSRSEGSNAERMVKDPFVILGMCVVNITGKWRASAPSREATEACNHWFARGIPHVQGETIRPAELP